MDTWKCGQFFYLLYIKSGTICPSNKDKKRYSNKKRIRCTRIKKYETHESHMVFFLLKRYKNQGFLYEMEKLQ